MIPKFRAKKDDISDSSFVYGDLIYSEDGTPRILTDRKELLFTTCLKGTEGMSAGLKDRNGIEIFEGDFLKWAGEGNLVESNIRRVEWTDRFSITPLDFAPFGECWEVIGNVYDNKELLEAKK